MSWLKQALGGQVFYHNPSTLPTNYWGQVDVWVSSNALAALEGVGSGTSLLDPGFDDVALGWNGSQWNLVNAHGGVSAPFTADTTHTIKYHLNGSTVSWYLDGSLVGTATIPGSPGFTVRLGSGFGLGVCCEAYYWTNFALGTTDGGTDIFADDFSGGLVNWNQFAFGGFAAVVTAPLDSPCATLTITPPRGQPGAGTITLTGSGYVPGSPLALYIENRYGLVETFAATADAGGSFTTTMIVPYGFPSTGALSGSDAYVVDVALNVGCSVLAFCGARSSDGINTNPPTSVLATGGPVHDPHVEDGIILDYIFHDGAHWVLWQDPSVLPGSVVNPTTTFPPPTNHTLNVTMISADGSTVTDHPIDTGYNYELAQPANADHNLQQSNYCCCPPCGSCDRPVGCDDPLCNAPGGETAYCITWQKIFWFTDWWKQVFDAKFASDGTTLWVAVLTREMVPDVWSTQPDVFPMSDPSGFVSDRTDASVLANYNPTFRRSQGLLDFCHDTAFPVTDGGYVQTANWDPPVVRVYSGGSGGFNYIGSMEAQFCPGRHNSPETCAFPDVSQTAQRGSFFSGLSFAASSTQPGICHLVWSEGGDNGTWGESCGDDCGCPNHKVWDAGPDSRDYRVGYSTWTPTAKASEVNLFQSHIVRQHGCITLGDPGWYFVYGEGFGGVLNGYTWPQSADLAAASVHQVVNDTGSPILFISFLQTAENPFGVAPDSGGLPWVDNYIVGSEPTVRMYDISGGTAVPLQHITPDLIPTEAEASAAWTPVALGNPAAFAPDRLNGPRPGPSATDCFDVTRYIGVSLIYDDPLLGGNPVYLVRVPWARGVDLDFGMTSFYRVPVDGSAPFDFADGVRQLGFTVNKDQEGFYGDRFFSDPRNIWIPTNGLAGEGGWEHDWVSNVNGLVFDRICAGEWQDITQVESPTDVTGFVPLPVSPGFHYDPESDNITYVALDVTGTHLFQVTSLFICRGCRNCSCGTGVHIAHRV